MPASWLKVVVAGVWRPMSPWNTGPRDSITWGWGFGGALGGGGAVGWRVNTRLGAAVTSMGWIKGKGERKRGQACGIGSKSAMAR